ncbi:uncharacterized protein LOC133448959 isoform X4 [Cololabis saira]|uniref:uncharacterized protein LOC133448959 isoform X4 n=1 Tax=Cololabis saira TaxID=129043 RepID=UPI002AD4889E|nr:uncharacterized protein LOC133448959 isoform X4 [Cololabis saira]
MSSLFYATFPLVSPQPGSARRGSTRVFFHSQVTPSVFSQEMSQSTEGRLRNISSVQPPLVLERFDMNNTTHPKLLPPGGVSQMTGVSVEDRG